MDTVDNMKFQHPRNSYYRSLMITGVTYNFHVQVSSDDDIIRLQVPEVPKDKNRSLKWS